VNPQEAVSLLCTGTDASVAAMTPLRLERPRILRRDRLRRRPRGRTAAATFGAFSGACSAAPNSADATKF
jgi:hypothetical protein